MKRGLIAWDRNELPPSVFESRIAAARQAFPERGIWALVVYTDVWRSNRGRYFSNFMPYWNRALLLIPAEDKPVLLCSLSPRVYPWIKSVTILEDIKPSPNLVQQLLQVAAQKNWNRIGVLDLPGLPNDLWSGLQPATAASAAVPEIVDVPWSAVRPQGADEWELAMYRHAAKMARTILEEEIPGAPGQIDYEFVGGLERKFRRAGAEDLVVLVTNGQTPPLPARGARLEESFSVSVALEYRGHWVKVVRPRNAASGAATVQRENLAGPYPYQPAEQTGSIFVLHREFQEDGRRLFHGDTYFEGKAGAELL